MGCLLGTAWILRSGSSDISALEFCCFFRPPRADPDAGDADNDNFGYTQWRSNGAGSSSSAAGSEKWSTEHGTGATERFTRAMEQRSGRAPLRRRRPCAEQRSTEQSNNPYPAESGARSNGATERRSDGATEQRSNGPESRQWGGRGRQGATEQRSEAV